jgi:hypothetical protein
MKTINLGDLDGLEEGFYIPHHNPGEISHIYQDDDGDWYVQYFGDEAHDPAKLSKGLNLYFTRIETSNLLKRLTAQKDFIKSRLHEKHQALTKRKGTPFDPFGGL